MRRSVPSPTAGRRGGLAVLGHCLFRRSFGAASALFLTLLPVASAEETTKFPRLKLQPPTLDFGRLGTNEKATRSLKIWNLGDVDLELTKLKPCCSIIKHRFVKGGQTIPPNDFSEVEVELSTGWGNASVHKVIDLDSNDPYARNRRIKVRAEVHPEARMVPFAIPPQSVGLGRPKSVDFKVLVRSRVYDGPFDLDKLEVVLLDRNRRERPTDEISLRVESLEGTERGYHLHLTFLFTETEGRFQGRVRGELNGYRWIYRFNGEVFRGVQPDPRNFSFQRIKDPVAQPAEVTLTSTDGLDFEILDITAEPDKFDFTVESNPERTRHVVRAVVHPREPGETRISGRIRIITTHPEKEVVELRAFGAYDPGQGKSPVRLAPKGAKVRP